MAYRHRIEQAQRRHLQRSSSRVASKPAGYLVPSEESPEVAALLRALTIRQRTFLRTYLENGGNGTKSALTAYNCTTIASAEAVARETLKSARVQRAYEAILAAGGLSDRALRGIHLRYLSLHASPDVREKQLGLTALRLGYKVTGAFASERLAGAADPFGGWTEQELATFAETGCWPARFASRLRVGAHISDAAPTSAEAPGAPHDDPEDGDSGDPADDGSPAATPPPDRRETAPAWPSDPTTDDVAEAPEADPPRRLPKPSRAPDRPARFQPAAGRPEDRVYSPPRPPAAPPASAADRQGEASADSATRDWAAALDANWKRDRLPGW